MTTPTTTTMAVAAARARWRHELFGGPARTAVTLAFAALALGLLARALSWGLVHAVFRRDADLCRANDHVGACWGVVAEKFRAIAFGRYPRAEQWRPALGTLLLLGAGAAAIATAATRGWRRWQPAVIAAAIALGVLLMRGGPWMGLARVPTTLWGGLPLTLLLALVGLGLAFPLGVLLALGRRSELPALRVLCRTYIELGRGVPLISVLFMAAFLLPLVLPQGLATDLLLRVLIGLVLFVAAYLAEVVRGGLQAVSVGQADAARALGLSRWQVQRHVLLPQALRAVVPALMNSVIGTVKESSLVTVVGLYDLTGALALALGGDPTWRPFYLEGYLFVAALYWTLCFTLSRVSRRLERRLNTGG